jgi:outer membrane biosynthesis protein TonB
VKYPNPFSLLVVAGLAFVAAPTVRAAVDPFAEKPLRIIQRNEAPFPQDLLATGVSEGQVHAVLAVDATGKLLDYLVTAYTHRELVRDLVQLIRTWDFEPAMERGVSVGQRVEMVFTWRSTGGILSQLPAMMVGASLNRKFQAPLIPTVCKPHELDRKPVVLESVAPLHPGKALSPPQLTGYATIDFYIDPEGRPRMPVPVRASDEAFAITATDALLQWRFEPITSQGRPVSVRMVQEFIF